MKNYIFYVITGFLFTHEMDAVSKHEWKVLPLTSWMNDSTGYFVFLFAHIPLFALLTALFSSSNELIKKRTKTGFAIFAVFHSLLHLLFMKSNNYEFNLLSSNILIFGAGFLGIIYLITDYSYKKKSP